MKKKKSFRMIAMLLTVGLCLSGCGSSPSNESSSSSSDVSSKEEGIFSVGIESDLNSMDSIQCNDFNSNLIVNNMYDTILKFSQDGSELEPNLAKSWNEVDDVTYVYEIRDDVKFWDGNQMTVDDVIYSLTRNMDVNLASLFGDKFTNIDSIEKTGDWEMTVKLKQADTSFVYAFATMAGAVVEKSFVESNADTFGKSAVGTMATGPFQFDSWTEGSQIVLTKNENYWNTDTPIIINKLEFDVIQDSTSSAMALTSGQIDFINTPNLDVYDQLTEASNVELKYEKGLENSYLAFNCSKGPFSDPNVRKAVACAIDEKAIANAMQGDGYYTDAKALDYDPEVMGFDTENWVTLNDELDSYRYNIEKAKEYLSKSDYPDGFECSVPVSPISQKASEAIQYYLQELNITVNLETVTFNDYIGDIYGTSRDSDGNRDYDMIYFTWFPDYSDPISYLSLYYGPNEGIGGPNMFAFRNDDFDALIEKQKGETGEERSSTMQEAYKLLNDNCPRKMFAYFGPTFAINNKYDLDMSPMWLWNFNFSQVTESK